MQNEEQVKDVVEQKTTFQQIFDISDQHTYKYPIIVFLIQIDEQKLIQQYQYNCKASQIKQNCQSLRQLLNYLLNMLNNYKEIIKNDPNLTTPLKNLKINLSKQKYTDEDLTLFNKLFKYFIEQGKMYLYEILLADVIENQINFNSDIIQQLKSMRMVEVALKIYLVFIHLNYTELNHILIQFFETQIPTHKTQQILDYYINYQINNVQYVQSQTNIDTLCKIQDNEHLQLLLGLSSKDQSPTVNDQDNNVIKKLVNQLKLQQQMKKSSYYLSHQPSLSITNPQQSSIQTQQDIQSMLTIINSIQNKNLKEFLKTYIILYQQLQIKYFQSFQEVFTFINSSNSPLIIQFLLTFELLVFFTDINLITDNNQIQQEQFTIEFKNHFFNLIKNELNKITTFDIQNLDLPKQLFNDKILEQFIQFNIQIFNSVVDFGQFQNLIFKQQFDANFNSNNYQELFLNRVFIVNRLQQFLDQQKLIFDKFQLPFSEHVFYLFQDNHMYQTALPLCYYTNMNLLNNKLSQSTSKQMCFRKFVSFMFNEKRICKLLNINPAVLGDHNKDIDKEQKYILSVENLIEVKNNVSLSDQQTIQFRFQAHCQIAISLAFGVDLANNQVKADNATVPQHFQPSKTIQQFSCTCKQLNVQQLLREKQKKVFVLVTGIGALADNQVNFQILELDFSQYEASQVIKIADEIVKVGENYYQLKQIYGANQTPQSIISRTTTQKTNTQISDNNQQNDNANSCCICLDNNPTVVAIPCRHLILCTECAESFRSNSIECPLCRVVIDVLVDMKVAPNNHKDVVIDNLLPQLQNQQVQVQIAPKLA